MKLLPIAIFLFLLSSAIAVDAQSANTIRNDILNLQPGNWYEIPNTHLRAAAYNWSPNPVPAFGGAGFDGVMSQWNGGAFDTANNRLIVFGGGHNGYYGNEVYAFSMNDFKWKRISDPSSYDVILAYRDLVNSGQAAGVNYYSDGLPKVRHTYNLALFNPAWNAFVLLGIPGGGGSNVDALYLPPDDGMAMGSWSGQGAIESIPLTSDELANNYGCSAVDPANGHIWYLRSGSGTRRVHEFDGTHWYARATGTNYGYYNGCVIDPERKLLVKTGGDSAGSAIGYFEMWNISSSYPNPLTKVTTSSQGPQNVVISYLPTPSMEYDPVSGRIVAWLGGKDVYSLDVTTNPPTWTLVPGAPNSPTPTPQNPNGDFSRWRYVPSLNVFIKVSSVDQNVWVYKYYPNIVDTQAPTVTSFLVPPSSVNRTFSIISFVASDNVGVTGYMVTESATPPLATDPGWSASPLSTFSVSSNGLHTLYAWARDWAGNVGSPRTATITITSDVTAPSVTNFTLGTPNQLTVPVASFIASDNVGVTGYIITESSATPLLNDPKWTLSVPTNYTASGDLGSSPVTLYAWARDAQGNVGGPGTVQVTLTYGSTPGALRVGPNQMYKTPAQAAAAAKPGDVIEIDAGTYSDSNALANWNVANLTIRGVGGYAHMQWSPTLNGNTNYLPNGKAIWLQQADNLTVENIEFSGAQVADKNGAGIRYDGGKGLIVRHCYFHDNEDGILYGAGTTYLDGDVFIEYSEFGHNGAGDGQSHNMYIGHIRKFTLQYSYSHSAKIGHLVKTRAEANYILYNRLTDEADGSASYEIDIPQGGYSYVIGNILEKNVNADSASAISYAREVPSVPWNSGRELYIIGNTYVDDLSATRGYGYFIRSNPNASVLVAQNNIVVGKYTSMYVAGGSEKVPTFITNLFVKSDPGFVNMANYDYRFAAPSNATGMGTNPGSANGFDLTPIYQYVHPLNKEVRPSDGQLDIGGYEFINSSQYAPKIKVSLDNIGSRSTSGRLLVYSGASLVKEINFTTNATGDYAATLIGVPETVNMKVVVGGFLARNIASINLSTATQIAFPPLLAGDLNGDNVINSLDFSDMNTKWYTSDQVADLNKDGIVNALDFSLMNKNWMRSGE